jgi:hypothetical protein
MTAAPTGAFQVRLSPSATTPSRTDTIGTKYVTVEATVAPTSRMRPYWST